MIPVLGRHNRKASKITKDQEAQLEMLFFMDGITSYAASKQVGIAKQTAREYFEMWAADLVSDNEYETWAQRQKRVRARALEGIAKRILELSTRKNTLVTIYENLIFNKPGKDGEFTGIKGPALMEHELVLSYDTRILALDRHLAELQAEYDSIEARPPAEIILRQELLAMMEELETTL